MTTRPRFSPRAEVRDDEPTLLPLALRLEAPVRALPAATVTRPPPARGGQPRLGGAMALRDLLVAAGTFVDVATGGSCGAVGDDTLSVVLSGGVALCAGESALATLRRGDAFGFVPPPFPGLVVELVAVTPVRLVRVSATRVQAALAARPELATQIARAAATFCAAARRLSRQASGGTSHQTSCPPSHPAAAAEPARVLLAPPGDEPPGRSVVTEHLRPARARPRSVAADPRDDDDGQPPWLDGPWEWLRRALLWVAVASGPVVIASLLCAQPPVGSAGPRLSAVRTAPRSSVGARPGAPPSIQPVIDAGHVRLRAGASGP